MSRAAGWTRTGDLKAQLNRRWERGELLRQLVTGETPFPLHLALKGPTSAELTDRFAAVRSWVTELASIPNVRIEWRTLNHRVLGAQRIPRALWVDTLDDALGLIGRGPDADRFAQVVVSTRSGLPALLPWLAKRPLQAIELAQQWPRLLAVVTWLIGHPRPGIYLRQVDIPGVHTKLIERHRAVLAELLDLALPPCAIAAEHTGVGRFAARYGFLDKPIRIRFRVLDQRTRLLPGPILPDLTLDADSFARLNVPLRHVFITENETNFLAFPAVSDAMVIFGAGYGWDALARSDWLGRSTIYYWGDIDTHGFAILDQLRSRFENVASFLMDRDTLLAHEALWGEEAGQVVHDLPRLTGPERALFDELRDNRIRKGLRLEQERVGFRWVTAALEAVTGGPAA